MLFVLLDDAIEYAVSTSTLVLQNVLSNDN